MEKIVARFKTEQDVERYLQAVEEYTDWTWGNGCKPTSHKYWKDNFSIYQDDGGFCIRFENQFSFSSINYYGKGREIIHFEDAILQLKKQSMENEMKEGDLVYVSDVSEKEAMISKEERILLRKCSDGVVCVAQYTRNCYIDGKTFDIQTWKYAVPASKEQPKKTVTLELTNEQLEKIKEIIK